MGTEVEQACPGCGAVLPTGGAEAPPHIGASPGCWSVYGDVVAREQGEWGNSPVQRLTVDTYAAQHPGTERSRRVIAATAAHLIGVYLWVERGVEARRVAHAIGRAVENPEGFAWLEPPPAGGALTILDVVDAADERDHVARVERWARSVWESWSDHHETIRRWAGG